MSNILKKYVYLFFMSPLFYLLSINFWMLTCMLRLTII
ncbi:hypothetical protein C5167_003999 [Papaver somniferum]|nr:hypothetical protein C5167_003999 [Papaver somniferum]